MGELKDWADSNSKFIKLNSGDSVTGKYEGHQMGSYKGTPLVEYKIDGKVLSSGSSKLATRMDSVTEGAKVKITRFGEGYDTNYEVEIVPEKPVEAWDEEK